VPGGDLQLAEALLQSGLGLATSPTLASGTQGLELLALTHDNLSRLHFRNQNHGEALQHGLRSMDYVQRLGQDSHTMVAHLHVAAIQERLGDNAGSLHHLRQAAALVARLPDPLPIEALLMKQGNFQQAGAGGAGSSRSQGASRRSASAFELPRGCCEAVVRHNLSLALCLATGDVHGALREATHAAALAKRAYPETHHSIKLFQASLFSLSRSLTLRIYALCRHNPPSNTSLFLCQQASLERIQAAAAASGHLAPRPPSERYEPLPLGSLSTGGRPGRAMSLLPLCCPPCLWSHVAGIRVR